MTKLSFHLSFLYLHLTFRFILSSIMIRAKDFKCGKKKKNLNADIICISHLPPPFYRNISRDLADADADGRLSRDEFAVAMHLIRAKLAGKDVPDSLPPTLIPPFPRSETTVRTNDDQSITAQPAAASGSGVTATVEVPIVDDEAPRSSTPPPPYESVPTALQ